MIKVLTKEPLKSQLITLRTESLNLIKLQEKVTAKKEEIEKLKSKIKNDFINLFEKWVENLTKLEKEYFFQKVSDFPAIYHMKFISIGKEQGEEYNEKTTLLYFLKDCLRYLYPYRGSFFLPENRNFDVRKIEEAFKDLGVSITEVDQQREGGLVFDKQRLGEPTDGISYVCFLIDLEIKPVH